MSLLLDTCTFLWLGSALDRLSEDSKKALRENADNLFVSAISALEIAFLSAKKRIQLSQRNTDLWFRRALAQHGVSQVPINFQIAAQSGELPLRHKDPFDRLIVATALEYKMTIVTPDELIQQYKEVGCLW